MMLQELARAVTLMAIVPGALVGLLIGLRSGFFGALIATVLGAAGGFGGALALSQVLTPLNIEAPYISPLTVIGGSIVGGFLVVLIASALWRAVRD